MERGEKQDEEIAGSGHQGIREPGTRLNADCGMGYVTDKTVGLPAGISKLCGATFEITSNLLLFGGVNDPPERWPPWPRIPG